MIGTLVPSGCLASPTDTLTQPTNFHFQYSLITFFFMGVYIYLLDWTAALIMRMRDVQRGFHMSQLCCHKWFDELTRTFILKLKTGKSTAGGPTWASCNCVK